MSTVHPWSAPRRSNEKLADQVASLIEERILDGTLSPGQRLPIEAELAEQMNVSRTVVRDAVRALATRRLLDVRQGRGTTVTTPSPDGYAEAALIFLLRSDATVGDLWDARQLLDAEMTAAAIRSGDADWGPAESALEAFAQAIEEERVDDLRDLHQQFHLSLMTATRNPVIDLLLTPMREIIMATSDAPQVPAAVAAGFREQFPLHPPLLDAAMRGDEAALRTAVAEHYRYTTERPARKLRRILLRDSPAARAALDQARPASRRRTG